MSQNDANYRDVMPRVLPAQGASPQVEQIPGSPCQGEGRGFESRRPLQRKSKSRPCEGLKSAPHGASRGAVHHICTTFAELFPPIAAGEPLFSRVRVAASSWLGCVGPTSPRRHSFPSFCAHRRFCSARCFAGFPQPVEGPDRLARCLNVNFHRGPLLCRSRGHQARAGRTHGAATPAPLVDEDLAGEGSGNLLDLYLRGDLDCFGRD